MKLSFRRIGGVLALAVLGALVGFALVLGVGANSSHSSNLVTYGSDPLLTISGVTAERQNGLTSSMIGADGRPIIDRCGDVVFASGSQIQSAIGELQPDPERDLGLANRINRIQTEAVSTYLSEIGSDGSELTTEQQTLLQGRVVEALRSNGIDIADHEEGSTASTILDDPMRSFSLKVFDLLASRQSESKHCE